MVLSREPGAQTFARQGSGASPVPVARYGAATTHGRLGSAMGKTGNSNRQIDESQPWNPLKRPRPCLAGPAPARLTLPRSRVRAAGQASGPERPRAKTLGREDDASRVKACAVVLSPSGCAACYIRPVLGRDRIAATLIELKRSDVRLSPNPSRISQNKRSQPKQPPAVPAGPATLTLLSGVPFPTVSSGPH